MASQNICVLICLIQSPPPLPLQPYGSLHYRWLCLRRQGKALRVWWILYIIKLHFSSIPTSLHYKDSPPQRPCECEREQRPTAGFFWAILLKQRVQSFQNFHRTPYRQAEGRGARTFSAVFFTCSYCLQSGTVFGIKDSGGQSSISNPKSPFHHQVAWTGNGAAWQQTKSIWTETSNSKIINTARVFACSNGMEMCLSYGKKQFEW